jgi:F-type H+-transporting ATPase subunit b
LKMIEARQQLKVKKNAAMAELKLVHCRWVSEKLLKDELSNKEAQTKLVEKMLGDVKLN